MADPLTASQLFSDAAVTKPVTTTAQAPQGAAALFGDQPPAPLPPHVNLAISHLRGTLQSYKGKLKNEDDTYHAAKDSSEDFADKLAQQFPGIPTEEIKQRYFDNAFHMLNGQMFDEYTNKELGYLNSGAFGRRSHPEEMLDVLPDPFGLRTTMKAGDFNEAAKTIGTGQATDRAYELVTKDIARARYDAQNAQPGTIQHAWDVAKQVPAVIAEWEFFKRALPGDAGAGASLGKKLLTTLMQAGARSVLDLPHTAAGAYAAGSPSLGTDQGEIVKTPGEDFLPAFGKGLVRNVATNAAFQGSGAFEAKPGFGPVKIAASTGKALLAAQAAQEATYRLGGGGGGSVLTQLAQAQTPEERTKVLKEFGTQGGVFALLETVMHGAGSIDSKIARLNEQFGPEISNEVRAQYEAKRQAAISAGIDPDLVDAHLRQQSAAPAETPTAPVQPPTPGAQAPTEPAEPKPLFADVSHDDLKQLTASLGLKAGGSKDALTKRLIDSVGEKAALRLEAEMTGKSVAEPPPEPPPTAPEAPQTPPEPPKEAEAQPPAQPEIAPQEAKAAERPPETAVDYAKRMKVSAGKNSVVAEQAARDFESYKDFKDAVDNEREPFKDKPFPDDPKAMRYVKAIFDAEAEERGAHGALNPEPDDLKALFDAHGLTERQRFAVRNIARLGQTLRETSTEMGMKDTGAWYHVDEALKKLGVSKEEWNAMIGATQPEAKGQMAIGELPSIQQTQQGRLFNQSAQKAILDRIARVQSHIDADSRNGTINQTRAKYAAELERLDQKLTAAGFISGKAGEPAPVQRAASGGISEGGPNAPTAVPQPGAAGGAEGAGGANRQAAVAQRGAADHSKLKAAVEASRKALVDYGFSASDVAQDERSIANVRNDPNEIARAIYSATDNLETGDEAARQGMKDERKQMADHLRLYRQMIDATQANQGAANRGELTAEEQAAAELADPNKGIVHFLKGGAAAWDYGKTAAQVKSIFDWIKGVAPKEMADVQKDAATDAQLGRSVPTPEDLIGAANRQAEVSTRSEAGDSAAAVPALGTDGRPERLTAIANAVTDQERQARGESPILKQAAQADAPIWDRAMAALERDPQAGAKVVERMLSEQRPMATVEDNALLLHRRVTLDNEYAKMDEARIDLNKQIADARASGANLDPLLQRQAQLRAQETDLRAQMDATDRAATLSGSEAGRAFRWRRQLAEEDYSLGSLLRRSEASKGSPLTDTEKESLSTLHGQIKDLQEKLDAAEAALQKAGTGSQGEQFGPWQKAKVNLRNKQGEFQKQLTRYEWGNMTPTQKAADTLVRLRVAEVISSPLTFAKVGLASAERVAIAPVEQMIGSALSMLPGIKQIAAKAPVEGRGFDPTTEARALASAGTQGARDAWQTARTGGSDLDAHFGDRSQPYTWLDMIGGLHAAEKAPAVRAAYERAFSNIEAFERAAGRDVSSPGALERIGMQAYQEGIRAKFGQDNAVVDAWNKAISHLRNPNQSAGVQALGLGMKLAVPVVRVPTNIVAEAFDYAFGSVTGSVRAATALGRGVETLKPGEADVIMRSLKKGSLGLATLALGYYLGPQLGGFFTGPRKKGDIGPQEAQTPLGVIPAAAMHHPLLMALQLGSTVRRLESQPKQDLGTASVRGVGSLLEEVPFVREQTEVAHMFEGGANLGALGRLAHSFAIPQILDWIARKSDTDTGNPLTGQPVQRRPSGFVQNVETGVPGLRQTVPKRSLGMRR